MEILDPKAAINKLVGEIEGEPVADPAIEEGDLERDLPELDEKDVEEEDVSGVLPDDDEDKDKDN